MVISFQSCSPQTGWLSGKITNASVTSKISAREALAEEIREFLEFTESINSKPWGFGAFKQRRDQSYYGWNDTVEIHLKCRLIKILIELNFKLQKCKNKQ